MKFDAQRSSLIHAKQADIIMEHKLYAIMSEA